MQIGTEVAAQLTLDDPAATDRKDIVRWACARSGLREHDMMAEGRAVAVGIFENQARAHDAVGGLKEAGIAAEDIELLLATPEAGQHLGDSLGANAEAATSSDAPAGGLAASALDDTLSKVTIGAGPGVVAAGLVGYGFP